MAEFAGRKSPAHVDECGLEPSFMADAQLDAGRVRGRDRGLRIFGRRAQRLFAEDMTSRLRGGNDLLRMLLLWRAEDDGIDIPARPCIIESRRGFDPQLRRP